MKLTYIKKWILSIALVFMLAACMTACGSNEIEGYILDSEQIYRNASPTGMAVILGNHANAMAIPDDVYDYIYNNLDNVVYGGYLCAIISDSTPTKQEIVGSDYFVEDARNPDILDKRITTRKEELINSLKTIGAADSMEVDLLEAIREAKNALESSGSKDFKNKQIIIVDTGISTSGDLNFTTLDVLHGKPTIESVVRALQNLGGVGVLPDLKGITVTFIGTSDGLAEAAAPQIVSTTDKKYIKELWTTIVQECGAEDVKFISAAGWATPNLYTEDTDSEFQFVSSIVFYHDSILDLSKLQPLDNNDPDEQPEMPSPPPISAKIDNTTVGFKPDDYHFYNEAYAMQILQPYAADLKQYLAVYPDQKILIVGVSATTTEGGNGSVSLSLQRAEMVKQLLVDSGISESNLITVGLGAQFPWHVNEFVGGEFKTKLAQENRAVWLLSTDLENNELSQLRDAYSHRDLPSEAMEILSACFEQR